MGSSATLPSSPTTASGEAAVSLAEEVRLAERMLDGVDRLGAVPLRIYIG